MKRPNTNSGGEIAGGGVGGGGGGYEMRWSEREAKRAKPNGGCGGKGFGMSWSKAEAERRKPRGGCGGRGFGMRRSEEEAKMPKPNGGNEVAVAGGGGGEVFGLRWSELEAKRAKPNGGGGGVTGEGGGGAGGGCGVFGMRWSEAEAKRVKPNEVTFAATKTTKPYDGGEVTVTVPGRGGWQWKLKEAETRREKPNAAFSGEVEMAGEGEGGGYEWRWTEAASPEILALIFGGRMAADEVARTVPLVCRAWRGAAAAPHMWGDVDLEAWCRRFSSPDKADAVVRRLVRRARGTLRRLSAYRVRDTAFRYVAASGRSLNVLQIPASDVSDQIVEKHAECFPVLRVLDISNCLRITSRGIEVIGRHCKSLVQLKRNMPPPEPSSRNNASALVVEEEAMAIANSMPCLEQLELAYGRFSDLGLDAILTKCPMLCTLDILGCWNVNMAGGIEDKCCALESFREPWESEYTDYSSNEDDGDDKESESDG